MSAERVEVLAPQPEPTNTPAPTDADLAAAASVAFRKYPSFDNHQKALGHLRRLAPRVVDEDLWMAVEKVHGANFSVTFLADSLTPRYATRTQWLGDGGDFHGSTHVMPRYAPAMIALVQHLRRTRPGVRVQFFGELFGGMVQKVNRVFYCAEVDWRAFDLFLGEPPEDSEPIHRDEMFTLFDEYGVPHLKPRARGKLADLLALDPAFPSEIHRTEYNLPAPNYENRAEGMVLQPVVPLKIGQTRFILKHKNPTHMETKTKAPKQKLDREELPSDVADVCEKASLYVTLPRLANVLSKGDYASVHRGRIQQELILDALAEMRTEVTPTQAAVLDGPHAANVRDYMRVEAIKVYDEYLATPEAAAGTEPKQT